MRALIVDDEPLPAIYLKELIELHCFEIKSVEIIHSPLKAVERLKKENFNILFLDIEMPQLNGFELLDKILPKPNIQIVFITAYSNYAVDAFKTSAVHYILKPVTEDQLVKAVRRATQSIREKQSDPNNSLAIYHNQEYLVIEQNEIIRLQSDKGYTKIFLREKEYVTTKRFPYYELKLRSDLFFRCHVSHIINLKSIKKLGKGKFASVSLTNGDVIPVSEPYAQVLYQKMNL